MASAPEVEDALSEDAILYKALWTREPKAIPKIFGANLCERLAKMVAENDDDIPSMAYLIELYRADRKQRALKEASADAPEAKNSAPEKESSSSVLTVEMETMASSNGKVRGTSQTSPYAQTEGLLSEALTKYAMKLGEDSDLGKMETMASSNGKVRGTSQTSPYAQTEGLLSEALTKYAMKLGEDSDLGKALFDSGEAYRQLADIKYQLEDTIRRSFIDPITHLQNNELKDVVQVSQLSALVESQLDFHQLTAQVLETLHQQLKGKFAPPPAYSPAMGNAEPAVNGGGWHQQQAEALTQKAAESTSTIFDLEAQNDTEVDFKGGALIELVSQIDENWYEGRCNGRAAFFQVSVDATLSPPVVAKSAMAWPYQPSLRAPRPASNQNEKKQKKKGRSSRIDMAVKRQLLTAVKKLFDDSNPLAWHMTSLATVKYIMSQVPDYTYGANTLKQWLYRRRKETGSYC